MIGKRKQKRIHHRGTEDTEKDQETERKREKTGE
jgi:hypothetical protein